MRRALQRVVGRGFSPAAGLPPGLCPGLLVCALILSFSAAAQQPAAVQQTEGTPTFSANSNLVIVDVTIKDKSGKPIEGLKQNDFVILEDGKPQRLSVFEYQKLTMVSEPPPALSLDDQLKLPDAPKTTITSSTPGHIQFHDKRLLVFFFDFSSMGIPEQLRAQDASLDYLKTHITKDDMVATMLFTGTGAPVVLSDFTDDRDVLTTVIKGLPIGEATDLNGLADTGDDNGEDTGAAFVADETEFNIFNTDQKLAAIEQASKMLASFPEKKALVYFSAGVSKTGVDNQAQLEASINAAVKANLAIYPVDARGLMADPPGGGASKAASRGTGIFNGSAYNSQRASINDSQETLFTLAEETGGKAFLDSNDIEAGITQAQEGMGSYYLLGYYSTNNAKDGKYRRITVRTNNKIAGMKIEARPGYYADKVWGKLNAQDKDQQLKEALAAGDPVTELPLALQVDYFRVGPTAYFIPVSIKIPGSVVALAAKGGASVTQFDFVGQIQDERHATVGNVRDNIRIQLDQSNSAQANHKSFQYDAGFTLEPGRYQMKFVVRENITGKMGTFETKFIVPDLAADTSGLKLSSIIWSSQREKVTAAVGSAEKVTRKELTANPLIVGDEKVIPNITKVFRRAQNLYVNFDVYDSQPDPANTNARRVRVSMSFFNRKGVKAFEVGPIDATRVADTRPEAVPVQFQVPLKDLAAGQYICQINVVDEVGRRFAFPRAPLVIQ
ncbi:MAG TPA: VWA domain-containing protein [Bryobacteraceae bacterium]|jgi:VWFA-related protein|nr:VWA domain-containing protein [Bryobacteraceae bacterium]